MSKKDSKGGNSSIVLQLPGDKKYRVVKFEEKKDNKKKDSKPDDTVFAIGITLFVIALLLIL